MSDDCPKLLKANFMFVPQPLEAIQVNKQTLKLYPVVDSSMKPPKRAHAFQTNKTTLSIPGIDRRAMLDTLGAQLNLSTILDGILGDWICHFRCNWCNFAHRTILLFHSNACTQVNNTSNANNLAILLPVVNELVENCCKQVCVVQVQLNLDFASLVSRGIQALTILRVEFYIKLPQSLRNMTNGNNQPIALPPGSATLTSVPSLPLTSLAMSWLTLSRTDP
jgi:hypothetical protein